MTDEEEFEDTKVEEIRTRKSKKNRQYMVTKQRKSEPVNERRTANTL